MSAGDPGIAGWRISPPRCCTNVGQMSPGTRQQPRGAECIKVQTCYAGGCFKWGQARCWGCEVDASQRRSCKRRKEVCTWSSEREKLPSTSCLFIVGPERSPSGSVLVIRSAWEVTPAHPSGLFIPSLFLGGAAAGPGGAQGSGTARGCRAGETDAFLGGKSFYPKETTPRKAPLPTGKLCTWREAEILKRRT